MAKQNKQTDANEKSPDAADEKGRGKKLTNEQKHHRTMHRIIFAIITVLLIADVAFLLGYVDNGRLDISFYQMVSGKVSENLRIVELVDLHDREFGDNNETLINKVADLSPDIIVMPGDMVTMQEGVTFDKFYELCRALVEIAPTYYSAGNHEFGIQYNYDIGWDVNDISETGVTVLNRSSAELELNGTKIELGGFYRTEDGYKDDADLQEYVQTFSDGNSDAVKLMLVHEPNVFVNCMAAEKYDIDVVFSGHAHGGQIRIPLLGGLYAPDQGVLPGYTAGVSWFDDTALVISRGLGNIYAIPRINNNPEIVVLDINRY